MAWTSPRTWVAAEVVTAALLNTHVRDNLKAIGDAWTAWTPAYTNITIGNAAVTARYMQAGKLVHASYFMTVGSTTSFAAGNLLFSPPTTMLAGANQVIGSGVGIDVSGGPAYRGTVALVTTSTRIVFVADGGTFISNTSPWTWATGDIITWTITYETA
jgi:hypothetical protein